MPRPRKQPNEDDGPIGTNVNEMPLPPRTDKDGRPNIEYHRERQRRFDAIMDECLAGGVPIPFNADTMQKSITASANLDGFTLDNLKDLRSDADKMMAAANALLDEPDSAWEQLDADLELVEKGVELAVEKCGEEIKFRQGEVTPEMYAEKLSARINRGKALGSRIRRIIRLRQLIRHPRPNNKMNVWVGDADYYEAANPLVYMLYVHRANTQSMGQTSSRGIPSLVLRIGKHHARFAVSTWQARHGIRLTPGRTERNVFNYQGVLLIAHPGCGKSEFVMALTEREICSRPMLQGAYLHAVADQAEAALGYIQQVFRLDNPAGRRRDALFPGIRLDTKDNNQSKMRIALPVRVKSPTLVAAGVTAKALGSNTEWQVQDDVVPQSDRDQPTERERRKSIIGGTWGSRQRGQKSFRVVIGTIWHTNDYLADLVEQERSNKRHKRQGTMLVDIQRCGGPNTTPQFFPLWPEVYPAAELRRRYEAMRDPGLWSAAYEANPVATELQIIKKLRFYDPNDEEHTEFMRSAEFHVSVDPSATNRETSDKVGLIYAGLGEISVERDGQRFYQRRCRFLHAQERHANQVELADHIAQYALQRPVYLIHVECRSGFHATADILDAKYGLVAQRHDPTTIKKGVRLRAVAGIIDDSLPGLRAIVEFPGVWNGEYNKDGTKDVQPDPELTWFYDQFLKFGYAPDHVVDASSQLLNYFVRNGDLPPGAGEATEVIRAFTQQRGDPRVLAFLKTAESGKDKRSAIEEETQWIKGRWGGGGILN